MGAGQYVYILANRQMIDRNNRKLASDLRRDLVQTDTYSLCSPGLNHSIPQCSGQLSKTARYREGVNLPH